MSSLFTIATDDPDMAILIALAKGILTIEYLNEDCRSFYQDRMDLLRAWQE